MRKHKKRKISENPRLFTWAPEVLDQILRQKCLKYDLNIKILQRVIKYAQGVTHYKKTQKTKKKSENPRLLQFIRRIWTNF